MAATFLHCLLCGFETSEIALPAARATRSSLQAALAHEPASAQPLWDAGSNPRCPRCRGRLLLGTVPTPIWYVEEYGTPPRARRRRREEVGATGRA